MKPGDRVTIVHGPGPDGSTTTAGVVHLPTVNGRPMTSPVRADGKIAVHPLGATTPDAYLWVDPMYIDRGTIATSHRHRTADPDTARLAAEQAAEHLTEHQWLVLGALVDAGRTGLIDHEHEPRNGLIPTSAGKRRKELERYGLCEPTDMRRPTSRNALATVHRITARGIAVWQQHQQGAA